MGVVQRTLLLATLLLAGCSGAVGPTPSFEREATIAVGRTVSIVDDVSVQFVGVTGDSRCPADAMCIQGGDAIVRLNVAADGSRSHVDLHTGNMRPVSTGNVTIELLRLMPYPFNSRPIEPEDYQATIRVSR